MKKLKMFLAFIFVSFFALTQFYGCGDEVITNNPVTSTKGVFVLHEGTGSLGSSDYSFFDPANDSVYTAVFQNSNSGSFLNSFSDGMILNGQDLYITSQGAYNQPGSIFKINATTNQLISSRVSFGRNPYNLVMNDNKIYVTNIISSFVSIMDLNLSALNDSVQVGPNPTELVVLNGKIFISKATYTFENSLAIISGPTYQVDKIFFPSAPVSVAINSGYVYVSSFINKKIYKVDPGSNTVVDSSDVIPTTYPGISDLVAGNSSTLYVVSYDLATYSTKEVYKYDIPTKSAELFISFQGGTNDVYGIAYDVVENKLYVNNSKGGSANGEVKVYDTSGNVVKTYPDIGGRFSRRIAFKY